MGQTTQRVFKSASGAVTRTQNLAWDSRGRLDQVRETDSQTNGYIWLATYDGLGRRWYTFYQGITNGDYVLTGYQTTGQYYDPEAEFLELGVTAGGLTTWKLYGPDLNGRYGGLNGVGGLEAFTSEEGLFNPVIADARGNVIGSYDPQLGNLTWNSSRPTGYGAAPGYRPVPLGHGGNVAQSSAWRGRWPDITGFVCLGARYYNSESGTFLSSDPVWNGRDPNYYSFCGGDPINSFDPDGRFGVQSFHSGNGQLAAFEDSFINGTVGLVQLALYGAGRVIGSPERYTEWAEISDAAAGPLHSRIARSPDWRERGNGCCGLWIRQTNSITRKPPWQLVGFTMVYFERSPDSGRAGSN